MRRATLLLVTLVLAGSSHAASPAYTFRPVLTSFAVTHLAAPRSAPDRLYVVGQGGTIRLAVKGKLLPKPFLNIDRLVLSRGGEQGLLSIAFHPRFATNRLFYVDYTGRDGNDYVFEYRATKDGTGTVPGSARQLFFARDPGPEHNGGQLAFGPDGKLYVALGDGECCDDPQNRGNFGWDAYEGRAVKEAKEPNPLGRLVYPAHAYDHQAGRCSITGGFVYRGAAVPAARGRYFFGDYCTGTIWSLRYANGEATDVRKEAVTIKGLSTFGEDARGELYAGSVTTGRVYRLVR